MPGQQVAIKSTSTTWQTPEKNILSMHSKLMPQSIESQKSWFPSRYSRCFPVHLLWKSLWASQATATVDLTDKGTCKDKNTTWSEKWWKDKRYMFSVQVAVLLRCYLRFRRRSQASWILSFWQGYSNLDYHFIALFHVRGPFFPFFFKYPRAIGVWNNRPSEGVLKKLEFLWDWQAKNTHIHADEAWNISTTTGWFTSQNNEIE